MARYECSVCGYVYDEDQEGTPWDELPGDWVCPTCGAGKEVFEPVAAEPAAVPAAEAAAVPETSPRPRSEDAPLAKSTSLEPTLELIHTLSRDGLDKTGHHGPMGAMGVPRPTLPQWDDIQILPAQLARKPLAEDVAVGTELVIGPNARKPLRLEIPIFVSDMSFGALSEEAKTALAQGAQMAGTGIASGEGGMLPEENAANSRYLQYEQLPGRDRHSEGRTSGTAQHRRSLRTVGPVPGRLRGTDEGHGPRLRTHASETIQRQRHHDLEAGNGRTDGHQVCRDRLAAA